MNIQSIFKWLKVDDAENLEDFEKQYNKLAKNFVNTNKLCQIILNYENVFTNWNTEDYPSSIVVEARKTGKTIEEICSQLAS